jgi:FAD:protein FMN transferase
MIRCKPLLGTFVEISIHQDDRQAAIESAYAAIQKVQDLMSFYEQDSEVSTINRQAHLRVTPIHPWTSQIIRIAQDIHHHSGGLFNCGIGHRLIAAGLLPRSTDISNHGIGGIEDLFFVGQDCVQSSSPLCLDLGGIAKGFAVDLAVHALTTKGVHSGCVNAGGDIRVFGDKPQSIYIRNPQSPSQLINVGLLSNGAIATSGLYFSKRDQQKSYVINPLARTASEIHHPFSGSYSILANECVYADALSKVLILSKQPNHPCFTRYHAQAIRIAT